MKEAKHIILKKGHWFLQQLCMASCQTRLSDLQFVNSAVSDALIGTIHKVCTQGRGGGAKLEAYRCVQGEVGGHWQKCMLEKK